MSEPPLQSAQSPKLNIAAESCLIMVMRRFLPAVVLLAAFTAPAAAHPLPNTRYDRTVAVRCAPDGVVVKYVLEVSAFTIWLDGAKLFTPEEITKLDKTSRGFSGAYAAKIAPEIATDLNAKANGA